MRQSKLMTIKIAIIRHGDAPFHPTDSMRQLSPLGRQEAAQTADYLKTISFLPDAIIHSGLDRARDTAEIIREKMAVHLTCEVSSDLRPESNPGIWENNLIIWDKNLILVSHMPFLPQLCERLCGRAITFPTAGCIILEKKSVDSPFYELVHSNF